MILADTSIWIGHFRAKDKALAGWLEAGQVLMHPFIIGEIALGNVRQRDRVLKSLSNLPRVGVAKDGEVIEFISRERLFGRGIGYVDAHLLAGARLTPGTALWTTDKRLNVVAKELGFVVV